jgi:hypothetical protein
MTFNEILQPLLYGKNVRRSSWQKGVYINSNGDLIRCYQHHKDDIRLLCSDERLRLDDVTAEDWEMYK